MSKIVKIYCEGKKGSHDYDILTSIIKDLPSIILLEPIGSVTGAGAIINYKESEIVKSDFKIFFRDRDFDRKVPQNPCLEQDNVKQYVYYSYRNTIENYLFHTLDFWHFVEGEKLADKYGIRNENEVKTLFIKAAQNITYYQAIRHTMAAMRTEKTNFGTKLTSDSGILPANLAEEVCKEAAWNKIETSKVFADEWTRAVFEQTYNDVLSAFNEDFFNNLDFLIYFQGKDFAASLQLLLPNFPMKSYYKFVKGRFDYTQFVDLVELRELILSHA